MVPCLGLCSNQFSQRQGTWWYWYACCGCRIWCSFLEKMKKYRVFYVCQDVHMGEHGLAFLKNWVVSWCVDSFLDDVLDGAVLDWVDKVGWPYWGKNLVIWRGCCSCNASFCCREALTCSSHLHLFSSMLTCNNSACALKSVVGHNKIGFGVGFRYFNVSDI